MTLFELNAEIGGQFCYAREIPGKEDFHDTLRYFAIGLLPFAAFQLLMRGFYTRQDARSPALINIVDPDMIVVGGGMSKHDEIYRDVPPLLPKYTYHREPRTPIVRAKHGDASGVRGAAMLWARTP